MENKQNEIESFFRAYAINFNEALAGKINAAATAHSFAECFISVSPTGVQCGKVDNSFEEMIEEGYRFYTSCGVKAMTITSQAVAMLNESHYTNTVQWECHYDLDANRKGVIEFEVIYFLRITGQQIRIFGFITGDEQKAFRERGLIAGT